jgi:NADH-quinone oxidoreductase subunit M
METYSWIGLVEISLTMRVDGISYVVALGTYLVLILVQIGVWHRRVLDSAADNGLALLMIGGLIGLYYSFDFISFFIFFEIVLLASFFLPFIHGGSARVPSLRYFVLNNIGSMALLVAIAILFAETGSVFFPQIREATTAGTIDSLPLTVATLLAFFSFVFKAAVFPLSLWLPDYHAESPAPITAFLAGAILNAGAFGVIRYAQLIPFNANIFLLVAIAATMSMFYGGLLAMAQTDLKRLLAYSSISQMGYIFLGVASGTSIGLIGAAIHTFSHSVGKSLLFSYSSQYSTGHIDIKKMMGSALKEYRPSLGLTVGAFTLMGLPPTSGFIGEWMIFTGAFQAFPHMAAIAIFAVAVSAGYFIWLMYRVFNPEYEPEVSPIPPTPYVIQTLASLVAVLFVGIFPLYFVEIITSMVAF